MAEAAVVPATQAPSATPAAAPKIDELMLAMDVVDTLRHQERLVSTELAEPRRDAELMRRLRDIYHGQGIEVPDRVLEEGVRALKESRFVYTPPRPGLGTTLATWWVNRGRVGKALLGILAAGGIAWGAYEVGVVRPAEQRAEQARLDAERARIELTERLPRALAQGHAEVLAEAKVDAGRQRADQILADGRAALVRSDRAGAEQALGDLEALRADLRREYTLRIVSRPNEPSGVWRVPGRNRDARNYYLIVEPVAPDGSVLSLPVTSEEDRRTATVSRWGIRVSEEVFDGVRRDKNDDGIIQRAVVGQKRRGVLDVDYTVPVLGGVILAW